MACQSYIGRLEANRNKERRHLAFDSSNATEQLVLFYRNTPFLLGWLLREVSPYLKCSIKVVHLTVNEACAGSNPAISVVVLSKHVCGNKHELRRNTVQ